MSGQHLLRWPIQASQVRRCVRYSVAISVTQTDNQRNRRTGRLEAYLEGQLRDLEAGIKELTPQTREELERRADDLRAFEVDDLRAFDR